MSLKEEEERIYIGGIQPPKLTVEMVQKRMASSLDDRIDFVSFDTVKSRTAKNDPWGRDDDAQTFFFATVRCKKGNRHSDFCGTANINQQHQCTSPNDQGYNMSPFDIIAKHYHNVKWKGCTLRVEKAKLHILKRLEQERMEMLNIEQAKKMPLQAATTSEASNVSLCSWQKTSPLDLQQGQKIKRNLRIKRKFGEEAYSVDTKPIQTNNYKDFHIAWKKLRMKRLKHVSDSSTDNTRKYSQENNRLTKSYSNNCSLQSKSYLNRAVHIVFDTTGDASENDISTRSNSDSIVESYEWSDSDETDGNVSDDGSFDLDGTKENQTQVKLQESKVVTIHDLTSMPLLPCQELLSSSSSSQSLDDNSSSSNHNHNYNHNKCNSNNNNSKDSSGYVWSDSDSDSDSKQEENRRGQSDTLMQKLDCNNQLKYGNSDEFASELNDSILIPLKSAEVDVVAKHDDPDFQEKSISLEDDVRMNMKMAIELFPDLSGIQPVTFDARGEQTSQELSSGWDTVGLMKRYDPFASSASRYEVKDGLMKNVNHEENNMEKEQDKSSFEDSDVCDASTNKNDRNVTSMEENGTMATRNVTQNTSQKMIVEVKPKLQVYEQQKLEQVFQQDRTSQGTTGFQISSLFDQSLFTNVASGPSGQKQNFSFGFVSDEKENSSSTKRDEHIEELDEREMTHESVLEKTQTVPEQISKASWTLKKRTGLLFTDEEINILVEKFYSANEGISGFSAIMENPKLTEEDNKKWEEERKSLTLDWKRKYKQAKTLKKKKFN